MIEKITKYAGVLPLLTVAVYLLGYITLNSYLQSFGINENIGLDFKILKLGVLLAIIIVPIILLCYSTFKIGDYSNAEPDVSVDVINTLHDSLGYTIFYSLALGNLLLKPSLELPTYLMLGFLLMAFIFNKIKINVKFIRLVKGTFLIIPFFTFCFLSTSFPTSPKTFLYFLQMCIFLTCASLRIFNKEGITYQISKIGVMVTTVFYSSALFGAFIVGGISSQYGGEKQVPNTYYLNISEIDKVKCTALKPYIKNMNTITIEEVYDNTEPYYFKTDHSKIVAIPKSFITAEEINIPQGYRK